MAGTAKTLQRKKRYQDRKHAAYGAPQDGIAQVPWLHPSVIFQPSRKPIRERRIIICS